MFITAIKFQLRYLFHFTLVNDQCVFLNTPPPKIYTHILVGYYLLKKVSYCVTSKVKFTLTEFLKIFKTMTLILKFGSS